MPLLRAAHDVVVTGIGAVCAVGHDCDELLHAVMAGQSGIDRIARFDTDGFSVHLGAEVKGWPADGATSPARLCTEFSVRALREALERAGLAAADVPAERVGFVFGTGLVDGEEPVHEITRAIADEVGALGPSVTVSTACSSSTGAIGLARDLLALDAADVVLAGGADVLSPSVFAGFHALGVLSHDRCAPFSFPMGTTLGEGAGFLVLERGDRAASRSAPIFARLSGYGLSADAYHETSPDPEGHGVTRALRGAMRDAGVTPVDIGYVNAHGSGTEANDPAEWLGIRRGLDSAPAVPVSSTKGALGHAQGAAGVLESIVTVLGMQREFVAPTLNFKGVRKSAPDDPVGATRPRAAAFDHAVCLNSAFGGSNAALLYSRSGSRPPEPKARRPIRVAGVGIVGPEGLRTGGASGHPVASGPGRIGPFPLEELVPRTDPRGLDPSSRYLIAAGALSLQDADMRLRGPLRDQSGIVSGTLRPSPESVRAFGESITARGLLGLSAAAFARIVLNAPVGFCAKELGLRGPHTALAAGAGSGLLAIIVAAEILSTRSDVAMMLGASVDELGERDAADVLGERATSVVLVPAEGDGDGRPRLAGWGVAGPKRVDRAIAQARGMAGEHVGGPEAVFDEESYTAVACDAWAVPSALAFCDAVQSLRGGRAERALVTSSSGASLSLAAILHF